MVDLPTTEIIEPNLKGWLYSHPFILYTTIVDFWKGG